MKQFFSRPASLRQSVRRFYEHFSGTASALFCLAMLAGLHTTAQAQLNGGRGPSFVRAAWNLEPGYLTLGAHTRFYGKVADVTRPGVPTIATTYWVVQGGFSLNYGISRHFEASFAPNLYQDTNRGGKGFNLPDDIVMRLKIGSFGARGSAMNYGVELAGRIPTGKTHNVPFESYSSGKFSFGLTGLASYAHDPLYPEDGLSLHFNLGYWNHNDVGEKLNNVPLAKDSALVTQMTQEFNYGAAIVFPSEKFNFRFELMGSAFLNAPPVSAYSREPMTYFSPGVSYKAYRWMTLEFNSDIRLSGETDKTDYKGLVQIAGLPNYPAWRATLGMKLTLLPTSLYSSSERELLMRKAESRRELFEQIIKEQRETEAAEAELERIKDERRKAERELDRLRRILEGEAKRQQQENSTGDNGEAPPQR